MLLLKIDVFACYHNTKFLDFSCSSNVYKCLTPSHVLCHVAIFHQHGHTLNFYQQLFLLNSLRSLFFKHSAFGINPSGATPFFSRHVW